MHAVDLIAGSIPKEELPEETQLGICCVTGEETETIDRSYGIKPSFTNFDLLKSPSSNRVGVNAWRALNYRPARQSSWICDGITFTKLKRIEVREVVLKESYPDSLWSGYVTTSYKKHGVLRTPLNSGDSRVWLFEQVRVDCTNHPLLLQIWDRLRDIQNAGVPRPVIESLDAGPFLIKKVGWKEWKEFKQWAKPQHLSSLYCFLTYLLPSKEELRTCLSE